MEPEGIVFSSLLGLAAEHGQDTYRAFRNREADDGGADELSGRLSTTIEIPQSGLLVAMDAATLVTVGYQLVLGRDHADIDEPGWRYWVGELAEDNVTTENFLAALARGAFNDDFEGDLAQLNDQDETHLRERAALIPDPPRGGADGIAQDLALPSDPVIASPALEDVITDLPSFARSELAIEAIAIEPGDLEIGDEFEVTVTVAETTGVQTDGLSVNLEIDGAGIDETIRANGALSELSGETATVTFENLVINDPDNYTAVVTADAANAQAVSDEQGFAVVEPDAELAIEAIAIAPDDLETGDQFEVTVTVEETAGIETDGLSVNLVVDGGGIDETITANGTLSELDGNSATVTFDDLSIDDAGNYTAAVTANAENAQAVSADESFTVVQPDAELAIELTSIDPSEPEAGEPFAVTVTVEETAGIETDGLSVNLVIDGAGIDETITANGTLSELDGNSATVTFDDLSIDDAGNYTAAVTANAANAQAVSADESFTVVEPDAELAIEGIAIEPGDLETGDEFAVNVTVAETAGVQTDGLSVNLEIDGTDIDQTIPVNGELSELDGNNATVTFEDLVIDDPDNYTAVVTAEAANAAAVSDQQGFTVVEPDAELAIELTSIDPGEPEAGEAFTVEVEFTETAGITTDGLEVGLVIDGAGIDETITADNGEFSELNDDSATVTFEELVIDDPDNYTAVVTAEAANAQAVSDEQGFTVAEPDAELAIESIDFNPEQPQESNEFQVKVTVAETAGVETEGLSVSLEIDGAGIDETITADNGEFSELNDGSDTVTFEDLVIDDPDEYTAVVTADAANAELVSDSESFNVAPEQTGLAALQEDFGAPIGLLGQGNTTESVEAFSQ